MADYSVMVDELRRLVHYLERDNDRLRAENEELRRHLNPEVPRG